jgi:hypothetical protein
MVQYGAALTTADCEIANLQQTIYLMKSMLMASEANLCAFGAFHRDLQLTLAQPTQ